MQLLRTVPNPANDFVHRHAAHCESGVMSNLLHNYGLDVSEPMAFGLSSALLFAHLPFIKVEGFPLTAYRAVPGAIIKSLDKTIGVQMDKERFRRPSAGTARLNELVEAGYAVGIQASVFWLPYFPPDMRFHFNAHNLVVYAKQHDQYLISDPVFEHIVTCDIDALEKARFVKGVFAPKGLLYYPKRIPERVDLEPAIRKAVRKTAFQMLKVPVPYLGISGIRLLAKKIARLDDKQVDPRYARLYISFIVRMQEEIGTGGGGFRFLYASFLQEAAKGLDNAQLRHGSELMTEAGDAWREFALLGARYCKKNPEIRLRELADTVAQCADKEEHAFRFLKQVRI